jgi:F-type H+-transporting ATPase subunit delta
MKDRLTAKIYAQSLFQLGKEKNVDFAKELTTLTETINSSNDLENVLFLDVFTVEEKADVFKKIADKLSLNSLVINTVLYLIEQKRISLLPLIITEIIVADDHKKGFIRGTIEGSEASCDQEFVTKVKAYLQERLGKEPILDYKENDQISAGYKVTVEDIQFDASIDNQLQKFKQSILG